MADDPHSFSKFDHEAWIIRRVGEVLKDNGKISTDIYQGRTTFEERRERIRAAIRSGGIDFCIIGRNAAGNAETFAACFERFFGDRLDSKPRTQEKKLNDQT